MWYFRLIAAAAIVSGPLHARECLEGSPELLSANKWTAEEVEIPFGLGVELSISLENHSENDLRMVDGRVFFDDVLGRPITNIAINKDARVSSGGVFEQSGLYQSLGQNEVTRLPTADPSDIVITTCVVAAVTGSGEVLRFDE